MTAHQRAFAPLSDDELGAPTMAIAVAAANEDPVPILPVPDDAPPATFCYSKFGEASQVWEYRDASGRLLGFVARFDHAAGKGVLARTFCRLTDGKRAWQWRSFPAPRPIFGLDRLAARPEAPVLVVEGEKTAEAAGVLIPDHVVITWPGGANSVGKADWRDLASRHVTIWPDADEAGQKAAQDVGRACANAGAASITLVPLPATLPDGWDLADPIPAGVDLRGLLASARPYPPDAGLPPGYRMTKGGLCWRDPADSERPELFLAGPFEVVAETRDADGNFWGVLLEWRDHDGRVHRHALPRASLAGDGVDARRILLDGGLEVAPGRGARERLTALLASARSSRRATATSRIGWHGATFVLPDRCIGVPGGEEILLQGASGDHAFRERGTLEEWQRTVAAYAVDNSRLAIAISAAFAAALIEPCGLESGGIHFRGASSIGKTTALVVAGSAWGGGERGYVSTWRATANGLEGVAAAHCDALLCLDELSQVSAREAGEAAYMLANGAGKSRSTKEGAARLPARWRVLLVSSGETSLADKVTEDGKGKRLTAGQEVRIVDFPADAGKGLGIFEVLHGFPSAEALSRHLKAAAAANFGVAARLFIEQVAANRDGARDAVLANVRKFTDCYVPANADGQVHRVAHRFGLLAAAGELAVALGVLPWPACWATEAAGRGFKNWLTARGGIEPAELRQGVAKVRAFLHAHGQSRFVPWLQSDRSPVAVRDIVGYRRNDGDGDDFYVTPAAWREICTGFDRQEVARHLAERGLLILPPQGPHLSTSLKVPGVGQRRLYHFGARILEGDDDE